MNGSVRNKNYNYEKDIEKTAVNKAYAEDAYAEAGEVQGSARFQGNAIYNGRPLLAVRHNQQDLEKEDRLVFEGAGCADGELL